MTTTVACTNINLLTESQMPASPSNTELYAVELSGQPMDTNASNATSTGKSTIVGWGMPDLTAGVDISSPTSSHQMTYDCVVRFYASSTGDGSSKGLWFSLDNSTWYRGQDGNGSSLDTLAIGGMVYIPSGTYVKVYGGSSSTMTVYPLKGNV